MSDIEIKRGYEVLPDNNVRFGIRVINNSNVIISDVEVLLDYSESLFQLEGSKVQKLGTIPPSVPRTAKFILKPLGDDGYYEANRGGSFSDDAKYCRSADRDRSSGKYNNVGFRVIKDL